MRIRQQKVQLPVHDLPQSRRQFHHLQLDLAFRVSRQKVRYERQYQFFPRQCREDPHSNALPQVSRVVPDVLHSLLEVFENALKPLLRVLPERRQLRSAARPDEELSSQLGFQNADLFGQPLRGDI